MIHLLMFLTLLWILYFTWKLTEHISVLHHHLHIISEDMNIELHKELEE